MKKNILSCLAAFLFTAISFTNTFAAASVTLTTEAVPAANIAQATNTNVVYIAKMKVTTDPVTVDNLQFTLSGSHDNNDLSQVSIYFNAVSPTISGASFIGSAAATFAGPHTYSINVFRTLAAGTTGYFIITVNVNATATDNRTVQINGGTNPIKFGFTTNPNVTDNQSNKGGLQTIQGADVTLTSISVPAADIAQATNTNVVYIVKMKVTTEPATVNNLQFTLSGSHDNNDLSQVSIYFNAVSPTISGASFIGSAAANFAGPHTYSINVFRTLDAGTTGYFIITVNVNATATDDRTVRINGATDPIEFGFTTDPNVTDSQGNKGGLQTIQAADVTLTSISVPAADLSQNSNTNVVYIAKMKVTTEPATVNNVQFTLSGSHDNNDLSQVSIYFNAVSPTISGASFIGSAVANFAGPHTYSINVFRTLPEGSTGYFIITVNVNATATDNRTVRINGATDPIEFGFTTDPNVADNQSNKGGLQTIQAADITLISITVPAANILQGSNTNVIYITKMNVDTKDATVNNLQLTLTGSHDNNDLSQVSIYFNATSPTISGASFIGSAVATFAGPHTYSINVFRTLPEGSTGYFLITVNVQATATINHTVQINGATNPIEFGFITDPNVTDNQSNKAGAQTIKKAASSFVESINSINNAGKLSAAVNQISVSNIFPNPARNIITFSITSTEKKKVVIHLTDMRGGLFTSSAAMLNKGINKLSLNVTSAASGVYQFSVIDEQGSNRINTKVIVQH